MRVQTVAFIISICVLLMIPVKVQSELGISREISEDQGQYILSFQADNLASGNYFLRLADPSAHQTRSLLNLK